MISQLFAASLVAFITTDTFEVESCIGERFQLIKSEKAKWPIHSDRFNSAYVDFKILVDGDGNIFESKILRAEPKRVFDKESLRALKRWKFNESKYSERCFNVTFKFNNESD
ncbi:TonB family protein [Psychrobium sp. 1_MG-2023]|nr:TonB family protein [Psychrobium sp. 1_MG-2023]MDP2562947.1 TonB family protein [Psychrobium sp. 1_MG-2023]